MAGGKNIRTRSQAIVNDDLLLDFPPDTYMHVLQNNIELSGIKYLFVTHSHTDHFTPADLHFRAEGSYSGGFLTPTLEVFSNSTVFNKYVHVLEADKNEPPLPSVKFNTLVPYREVKRGKYTVIALPASHAAGEDALLYYITDGKSSLLYMHDTGYPSEEMLTYLKDKKLHADIISFDCTLGQNPSSARHLGLNECVKLRDRLLTDGVCGGETRCILNHFSHNMGLIHDAFLPIAEKEGFSVAFDGAVFEF